MKSIGAVLATAMLLSACSHIGMLGFEFQITPDAVKIKPMAEEASEIRSHCPKGHPTKSWC